MIFANAEGAEQTLRLITAHSTSVHIHPVDTQQRKHSFLVVYVYLMSFLALLRSLASSHMAASCCAVFLLVIAIKKAITATAEKRAASEFAGR